MAKTLQDYEDQLKALGSQLAQVGFMTKGTVVSRHTACGKAGCRCQGDRSIGLIGSFVQSAR